MDNLENHEGYYDLDTGLRYNPQAFTIENVAKIDAFWTDGSDEPSFAWLLQLDNGTWVAATGGHDYTGWDCQSGIESQTFPTREEAIRWGLTKNDRESLGLQLPEELNNE